MQSVSQYKTLRVLGRVAHISRSIGLEWLLKVVRNTSDIISLKLAIPLLAVTIDGLEIKGFLRHRSFLEWLSTGNYEPFTRDLFKSALKENMLVVDGGAHIGLYSLLASRGIGINGKVL